MKSASIFVIGLLFGLAIGGGALAIKKFGEDFWGTDSTIVSAQSNFEKVKENISWLPESARDIEFHQSLGLRTNIIFLGFTADEKDIELIISKRKEYDTGSKDRRPPVPSEHFTYNEELSEWWSWWPTSSKGMEVYRTESEWFGYDSENQRVYELKKGPCHYLCGFRITPLLFCSKPCSVAID
jgi:hypothetical protein